ncbi:glycoside hydrolase family 64 protein, partial [Mycobacterium intermedium]
AGGDGGTGGLGGLADASGKVGPGGPGGTGGTPGAGGAAGLFGSPGRAGATGNIGASGTGGPGYFPVDFTNNTGFADNEVYVTALGQTTPGQWSWLDQNGIAHAIDHTAADAPGHLTKGGVNYPNMSFTLADAHNFQIPPEFQGARIWMSIKEPLYIAINPTDTGYAGPDPINTLDPNYSTVYDWFELAYKYNVVHFGGNTSLVDQFGFPYEFTLTQTSSGFDQTRGMTMTRAEFYELFTNTTAPEFHQEIIYDTSGNPIRIIAPRTATPGVLASWLDPSIDSFWTHYATNEFHYDGGNYTVTGHVVGSQFLYDLTPTGGTTTSYVMARPTTAEIFASNGTFVGIDLQGAFLTQLNAAFNRGVANTPEQWANVASYYPTGERWNEWAHFLHIYSLEHLAYGFPFDDAQSQSSVLILNNAQPPTLLTLNLHYLH